MRCKYCYSNGGVGEINSIPLKIAHAAIDHIIANAINRTLKKSRDSKDRIYHNPQKDKNTTLSFHGGGEPLLEKNQQLLTQIIEYYRNKSTENDLNFNVGVSTNGAIIETRYKWVAENFNHINISFDGPADIQNWQRPLLKGTSFGIVKKFIRFLENQNIKYGIRSTITNKSVDRMEELIEFFGNNFTAKTIHFEPAFSCGRCLENPQLAPSKEKFINSFCKAKEKAKKANIDLLYSGCIDGFPRGTFCGAASGSNFFITPTGKVTTCLEMSRDTDSGFNVFHVGEYNGSKHRFDIDHFKILELQKRNAKNLKGCVNCVARLSCAGGCLAKTYWTNDDINKTGNQWWCDVNQNLLIEEIKYQLKNRGEIYGSFSNKI